jgi:hypothetical protein
MNPDELESSKLARQIGLNLEYYRCENEYIEMVKPRCTVMESTLIHA